MTREEEDDGSGEEIEKQEISPGRQGRATQWGIVTSFWRPEEAG